jgi:hypothetical protein
LESFPLNPLHVPMVVLLITALTIIAASTTVFLQQV